MKTKQRRSRTRTRRRSKRKLGFGGLEIRVRAIKGALGEEDED
jgi:hypothetical protein